MPVTPPRRVPNARRRFWVLDATEGQRREITARLRIQTPHLALWVEEGVWHDIRQLEQAAEAFDGSLYAEMRSAFGSEWRPGIDGSPRINILHATGLGEHVLGYTSSLDEYPSEIYPLSNEAEMITVNLDLVDPGSLSYQALLAREFLGLIQWHQDRNEERWVQEGLAELAASWTGSQIDAVWRAYLQEVDTPLAPWTDSERQRGAAYLFLAYFHQRFGDEGTHTLTTEPANGLRGFEATLDDLEAGLSLEDLLSDWLAAVYLDSVEGADGARYTFRSLDLPRPTASAVYDLYPVHTDTSVHQLGADYVVLRGETDLSVRFTGQSYTRLLPGMPSVDGSVWWSNRSDESLMTLTRSFDLRQVEQATLSYRLWYDIEAHYDYATVEVSDDDGEHWQLLRLPSGTDASPYGYNPGWGYTGTSEGWLWEEIDLSDYAGDDILVRFSYLTDGAVTGEGLLLDDVSIAEIANKEGDAAQTDAWEAQGFVRTDGLVPQRYLVLLITTGEEIKVERLSVDEDQSAEWVVPLADPDVQEGVLAVSALAPLTHQPAAYQLAITVAQTTSIEPPDATGD